VASKSKKLRFDGLYIAKRRDMWGVLRFYESGDVIYNSIMGKSPEEIAEPVAEWFALGHKHAHAGRYELAKARVEFAITTKFGPTRFDGVLDGKGGITIHSQIDGKKLMGPDEYAFYPVALS
jgi:hypothetical protein